MILATGIWAKGWVEITKLSCYFDWEKVWITIDL